MREKSEASVVSFFENELNKYKVLFGVFHTTKPITNYQKIHIKHYYIGRKWEKHKNQKVKAGRFAGNFVGVAKFCNPCKISQGCKNSQPLRI